GQGTGLDAAPVEERPVEAAEVFDRQVAVLLHDNCVAPRHGDVVEEDVAFGRAADRRLFGTQPERLPRAAAAGADDERGALDSEVLELLLPLLVGLQELEDF